MFPRLKSRDNSVSIAMG